MSHLIATARPIHRLLTILLLVSSFSCASIGVRTGAYSDRTALYPATAVDAAAVSYVATRPFISSVDPKFRPDAQEGLIYLFLPASIIDLPIAIALDTLLLPYDIYRYRNRNADQNPRQD